MEKHTSGFQGWAVKICHSHCNLCLEGDFICSIYCPFQLCQEEHLLENFNVWWISTESQKCDLSLWVVLAQYSVLPLWHKAISKIPPLKVARDKMREQLSQGFILQRKCFFLQADSSVFQPRNYQWTQDSVCACVTCMRVNVCSCMGM